MGRVVNCHGSFATATCVTCGHTCDGSLIEQDILNQRIARCPICCPPAQTSVEAGASSKGVSAEEDVAVADAGNAAGRGGDEGDCGAAGGGEESGCASTRGMELLEQARLPVSHGVMKPDIVFFNEALPRNFFAWLRSDLETLDLLLVIGTSLRVAPVSDIVSKVDADVPAILINREVSRMYPALQFAVCPRTNAPGGDTLVLGALVCSCY